MLKKTIETLQQENSELKSKLIVRLEEVDTLKQQTLQPSSLDLSDSNNESNDISPLEDSNENLSEDKEENQGSSEELSTIDLNTTDTSAESTDTSAESPDFESDISPIKLERTDSDSPKPTGGTKHKKKKQRRTRRKNRGKR